MPEFAFMSLGPSSLSLFIIQLTDFRLEHVQDNTRIQETYKTVIIKATEVINKSERWKKVSHLNFYSLT